MPRLRPRGPEPGLGRRVRVVALPAFPGLGVTATFVPGTAIAAELDAPGLDVSAIPTGYDITASLAFPGLAVSALCRAGTQAAATVAFPGLTTRADFFAALAAMPSLDVPRAIVGGPGLGAQPVFPGLSVPKADVRAILLVPLAATVAAPGLGVTAAATPPAGQFRLAPDYTIDWATLRAPIPAPSSVVQIGLPVSNGVRMSGHTAGASGELVGNVALVSRNKSGPGWTGGFTLKRTDAFAPASGGGAAFLILGFGMVGDGSGAQAQLGPYPWSARYDPLVLSGSATSFGVNADQWPTTTYANGNVCAAWGDGNGFNNDQTRSSLGVSEISGTPPALTGVDKYLSGTTGVDNRKPNAILHIGALVANNILLWHVNQTQDARVGTWTANSTNNGTAWTFHEAAGERVFSTGATPKLQVIGAVQLGPGYDPQSSLIDNNYAYLYLNNSGNLSNPFTGTNGNIWMCRVKIAGTGGSVANIRDPAKYSFFNGLVSGAPTWTADGGTLDTSKTVAVFPGGMGKHFLVGWSEVNNRFFAALTPTASTVAVYEAPTPFGPWGTLYYGAGSDANWTGVFTASLPGPWQTISKLWLAVSGAPPDSLDVQSSPLAALSNVGRPADVAQWPGGMEPVSTEFRDHTVGARLTFFFNNNTLGVDPPASAPSLAVFNADTSVTPIAADNPSTVLNQARNFPFVYTLTLSTASPPVLTLTQHDASVPSDTTITWTNALLATRASPSQGSFVWLCTPGRVAEITAESFTPPVTPQPSATVVLPGLDLIPKPQVDVGGGGTGFPNGYAAVRRLVRSAQADLAAESTADLPSFIDTTEIPGDWSFLATVSGKLLSLDPTTGFPYDILFTSDDGLETKLDHHIVSYDGATPSARFFLREPAGSTSDVDLRVKLYYGKAGLAATEERIAQVWQSAWLVIDPTSGADLTGKGHALTRSGSGLTNTTLDGRPAVLFAPAGYLRRTDPDLGFLDGLTDWTEAFWLKTPGTADGNVSRLGGDRSAVPAQPFPGARFATWVELSGSVGGGASVIEVGSNRWNKSNYDNIQHESVVNAADGTTVRHLIVVRETLKHVQLYDGEADIGGASTTGTPTAGTLHPQSTDNYSLGAGLGAQASAPAMTLGLYALFPKALSATWRAMLDRTQRDSSLCWAVGAEDLPTGDHSPVGKPWRDSISATTVYDLATHAFDPDAGASVVGTAVAPTSDTLAGYTVPTTGANAGKLVVAPVSGGPSGVGRPVVTLSDGTKTAKVKPYISISGVVVPPSGYYKTPVLPPNKIAVTTRAQLVTADALFATAGKSATHYISIEGPIGTGSNPDDSSKGSTLRLVGGGTRAAPYVITSPGAGGDNWTARASYKVFNTELELRQPWTWLYGLWTSFIPTGSGVFNTTDGSDNAVTISAANCFVTACRIRGSKGVYHEKGGGAHAAATVNFNWFEMIFQSSGPVGGGDMCVDSEQGGGSGHDWVVARNRSSDGPGAYGITGAGGPKNARFLYISPGQTAFLDWVIEYNFMDAGHSHYMEFKSGIKSAKWNHGTGTNNPYGGIYYRGAAPGGGEISYNRLTCQQTNMNGPNTLMVSNWHINSGGAVNGLYGLTAKSTKQSAQLANDLAGADGSIFVACKANILMPYYFEYNNYHPSSPLGKIAPIFFYGHTGSFQYGDPQSGLGAAGTLNFDGSGHPTNGGSDIYQPGVTKQSSIPSKYNPQTPPILDETVCGPAAPGLTWS